MITNKHGREILLSMVRAIQENKQLLGDIDGLIGDGDHGMNMNKGFSLYQESLADKPVSFTDGLFDLGQTLFNRIGGSMGPIYGTVFMSMSDKAKDAEIIDLQLFTGMLEAALEGLYDIVDARPGDKTLVDTLYPAIVSLRDSMAADRTLREALLEMKEAAKRGCESTIDMVAMHGRAARLGERSRGVPDAGATSCNIILGAMADSMINEIGRGGE